MAVSLRFPPRHLARAPFLRAPAPAARCSMAAQPMPVGVAQMTSTNDLESNFNICSRSRLVKEAVVAGADLLCLPEGFSFIGAKMGESIKIAQSLDGPIMQRYCSLARESNIWLSLGGFQEKGPDDSHLYNTHVLIDSAGNIRKTYREIHLFDVDVPGNMAYKESDFTSAGDSVVVAESPVGLLGLTVCYDLRFPELYQQLRFQHQAQVIAAAQTGKHNEKRESYGDSIIIDPWGTVIARLPDRLETGVAIAEVDLSYIDSVRIKCQSINIKGSQNVKLDAAPRIIWKERRNVIFIRMREEQGLTLPNSIASEIGEINCQFLDILWMNELRFTG